MISWIYSTKPLKNFIANRIKEIKETVRNQQWKYCPTLDNPADQLTRGTSAEKFVQNKLWMHGPEWITNEHQWPSWHGNMTTTSLIVNEEDEEPVASLVLPAQTENTGIHIIINLERFSNLKRLLRVTAYIFRFIHNCRSETNRKTFSCLSTNEIRHSVLVWIRNTQNTTYNFGDKPNKRSSIVRQLKLFKDDNEIFRCGGRIHNASLSENTKFPYLLPSKHNFTNLVIRDSHCNHLHSGLNSTVTHLRQSYWIPRIRQCVKTVLRKCVTCRKVTGKPYLKPDPPPLPKDRVDEPVPFTVTGVDFAGPLYVKNCENTKIKVYICLFTCASTRAVHLEIVTNLTEKFFMLAFRRFCSRKSVPKTMISDNALTFITASKEFKLLTNSLSLKDKLNDYGAEWKFIPSRAPWYGGFWERMIGLTKNILRKILGTNCVNLEILQTVISEIEAILNDRPLTYVSSESCDPEPLTPSHLLYGRRITRLPYPSDITENIDKLTVPTSTTFIRQADIKHELIRQFQIRWKNEYLTALREFHKTIGTNSHIIKMGDVVQIHDDSPRITWKLGVVDELCQGKDGYTRSVKIRTKHGLTSRPISKLYPLEVSDSTVPSTMPATETRERKSKTEAKHKIKKWTS